MNVRRLVAGVLLTACVGGCSTFSSVYDIPLPGGADVGDHPYRVTAVFLDVLDLVPQSGVKVDDVAVGRVQRIELAEDGRSARVTLLVNGSVRLPANAVAHLRQSSVLGEKFIELDRPPEPPADSPLADGAVIPLERTNRNPEVEEVFGALSMLLNGGGIEQIQQITRELNAALGGNEPQLRSFLGNLNTFTAALDSHRGEITRALDGLATLSGQLSHRGKQIADLIDNLGAGVDVLNRQRADLVTMLNSLNTLSGVAVDTINRSRDDLLADLRALEPTLRKLTESGADLPRAMQVLLTFPFPDSSLDAIKGDYLNTYLTLRSRSGRH